MSYDLRKTGYNKKELEQAIEKTAHALSILDEVENGHLGLHLQRVRLTLGDKLDDFNKRLIEKKALKRHPREI